MTRLILAASLFFVLGLTVPLRDVLSADSDVCADGFLYGRLQSPRMGRAVTVCYPNTWAMGHPIRVPTSLGVAVLPVNTIWTNSSYSSPSAAAFRPRTVAFQAALTLWDPLTQREMGGPGCELKDMGGFKGCESVRPQDTDLHCFSFLTADSYSIGGCAGFVDLSGHVQARRNRANGRL
jgi:hypothetical protein